MELAKVIFAILLPPVAVALEKGIGWPFWLNILLTLLGFVPGQVHAVWLLAIKQ